MTKPYQTTTPAQDSSRAPHHRTPVEMTALWARAIGLLALSALFVIAGIVGAVALDAVEAFGVGVLFAAIVGVPGAILALYTRLEHGAAYGRKDTAAQPSAPGAPIYFTRRMNVKGEPVDMGERPVDLGGMKPGEVKAALDYMRNGGKTSRPAMTKATGISQGQWSKLIDWLADEGYVANRGRAGVDVIDDLQGAIDDLVAQVGRW